MGDWTENTLVVTGPAAAVAALRDAVAGPTVFDGEALLSPRMIVPPPDGFVRAGAASPAKPPGWSDWALAHWGFDREVGDVHRTERDLGDGRAELTYAFVTAYFSAETLVRALVPQHPAVDLTLTFRGVQGWGGRLEARGGTVTHAEEHEADEDAAFAAMFPDDVEDEDELEDLEDLDALGAAADDLDDLVCPACGGRDVVPILYGLPSQGAFDAAAAGRIALGGCVVEEPEHRCRTCKHDF